MCWSTITDIFYGKRRGFSQHMTEGSGKIQSTTTLERFGSYCLLYPLAYGGMAAIYLARTMNAGAGRLLVVKRILPQIASDPMFLSMFRAEIRVCLELTHPNIVQVYDFGDLDGQPYIAMEYVEGKNLRELIERLGEQQKLVPIGISATVVAQAASALHHAHTARNRLTGEPLGIIHRDVTPHNILISYAGNAKVIDFGVAKAVVDDAEKTRAGGIKGKVRYLSPEQIQGEPLDYRSDIFSLGIVLWESLTSRQLFGAGSDGAAARSGSGAARDFEIMKEIVGCKGRIVPPSRFNPEVPPELDRIALKALSADRDSRYQNADELQEDLRRFLITALPGFNERAVGDQMQAAFAERIKIEREATRELAARAQRLLEAPPAPVAPPPPTQHANSTRAGASRVIVVPQHFSAGAQSRVSSFPSSGTGAGQNPPHGYAAGGGYSHSVIPPGERGETGQLPSHSVPGSGGASRMMIPTSIPTGINATRAGLTGAAIPRSAVVSRGSRKRGPQFLIYATAATALWSFAIWLSVQHHGPMDFGHKPVEAAVRGLASATAPQRIRLALSAPPEAAGAVPAAKPAAGDDNVAVLKSLVSDPLREVSSVVLRIAVEPKSSVPTRVIVNGKPLQGADSIPIELDKNVELRVERPSFIPFEDQVIVTRKDVDRFGVARLTVHLSEW